MCVLKLFSHFGNTLSYNWIDCQLESWANVRGRCAGVKVCINSASIKAHLATTGSKPRTRMTTTKEDAGLAECEGNFDHVDDFRRR